jgi:GH24 family phage-related lysozyme (muramidase)
MTDIVRDNWLKVNGPKEGRTNFMYLDVKGLVTTGVGNLADPYQYAAVLPWKMPDGSLAPAHEVRRCWDVVKGAQYAKTFGGFWFKKLPYNNLRLTEEDLDALVYAKYDQNAVHLKARFPDMPSWPAAARMAVHSMAWACGASFRFPVLESALRHRNWSLASKECTINETGNPGLIPRNKQNRALFLEALRRETEGEDLEAIDAYSPAVPKSERDVGDEDLPETQPEPIIHDSDSYFPERLSSVDFTPGGDDGDSGGGKGSGS